MIDEGYTGSIMVKLYNLSRCGYTFAAGDKIVQLLICPVLYAGFAEADEITAGERGAAGFGSTGK